ncbi:hypothetical protein BpHYR1_032214 [Brachionus plicatilis]|uniref:Uncharacterized protein n=1 Tax=Brachionus plicatilis TaxID=10195 RepID=A0A3M7R419_BRAPC|nr:hypothetical protein BpHYR1_032214 [Brachionus plicatilis]
MKYENVKMYLNLPQQPDIIMSCLNRSLIKHHFEIKLIALQVATHLTNGFNPGSNVVDGRKFIVDKNLLSDFQQAHWRVPLLHCLNLKVGNKA